MADGVVRALLAQENLRAVAVVATVAAQEGRLLHQLKPVSAALLGQALCAGALMAALQKDNSRVNLQLECDGPLRGLFVDASASGEVRGYVKNAWLEVAGEPGPFQWRPALGNSGYLSVLKDIGEGEYYRSSIQLSAMDLSTDLNAYFVSSEQVATRLAIALSARADEPLGKVAGVLLQALPGADVEGLKRRGETLAALLQKTLGGDEPLTAAGLLGAVVEGHDLEVLASYPLEWSCNCSKERVLQALASLGKDEIRKMIEEQGSAVVSCQFCSTRHEATREDLQKLLTA
ncbi:MAG: Hsp33 family molecular chaperone HslO [Myxococcaceae bacterium]|nr:Hsp33 family molecular chaperone HslO [Myxococcaceae bacterium]